MKNKRGLNSKFLFLVIIIFIILLVFGFLFGFFNKNLQLSPPCPGDMSVDGAGNCLISTCAQLQDMRLDLDANYKLTQNIDCSDTINWDDEKGFAPIGNCTSVSCASGDVFIGVFNGKGFNVSGLYINRPLQYGVGLLGHVNNPAKIYNVGLIDANISGLDLAGGIVGYGYNFVINNSYSTGNIQAGSYVGGLAGFSHSSIISNSYSTVNVNGIGRIGGLVGELDFSTINNSYATGNVFGNNLFAGGFAGRLLSSNASNCYSIGNVSQSGFIGAFAGDAEGGSIINNSYSSGNITNTGDFSSGFIGYAPDSTISNCYWYNPLQDLDCYRGTGGVSQNDGCSAIIPPLTDSYFFDISNEPIKRWDFVNVWDSFNGIGYPKLKSVSFCPAGISEDDYENCLITTCEQLQSMNQKLNTNYKLNNSIDCSMTITLNNGQGFSPVGNISGAFSGIFNGNNYNITNLHINRPLDSYVGLFGKVDSSGKVYDLGLINSNITGKEYVGILIGYGDYIKINNSYATGIIRGSDSVGGILGSGLYSNISNSYSVVDINCSANVGGLVGFGQYAIINNSYSIANINSSISGGGAVGGIIGYGEFSTILNSYSTGNMVGGSYVAGLLGQGDLATISNSYSAANISAISYVGGLVGFGTPTISNSYWYNRSQGLNCYSSGNTDCVSKTNESYFFNVSNEPMKSWNFANTWSSFCNISGHSSLGFQNINDVTKCNGYIAPPLCPADILNDSLGNCLITNCVQLQNMSLNLTANYKLSQNIDCSDTINWNSGKGFAPIGNCSGSLCASGDIAFTGIFNGSGNNISNLYVSLPLQSGVGLFGLTYDFVNSLSGKIYSVGLVNVSINGKYSVGGLVGEGRNSLVSNSYSIGNVYGSYAVGGLVGSAGVSITINNSYTIGNVTATGNNIGGIIGSAGAGSKIFNSYSGANVRGATSVGGLAGYSSGPISNSFSTGNVIGTGEIGGLVGSGSLATISNSYWYNRSQGLNCYFGGNTNCVSKNLESYFFNTSNEPMKSWNLVNVWNSFCNLSGYPLLGFQKEDNESKCFGYIPSPCLAGMVDDRIGNCLITNCVQLQNMSLNLTGNYKLSQDINCSATAGWNYDIAGGIYHGFAPIGNCTTSCDDGSGDYAFTGIFDGNDHKIQDLYINQPSGFGVGLFGLTYDLISGNSGKFYNVGLANVNVNGSMYVGGLVGFGEKAIVLNSYVDGKLNAGINTAGGLLGWGQYAIINNSYSNIVLTATNTAVGGLVGAGAYSNISTSYSAGNISGSSFVGGLIGTGTSANISNSYSTANLVWINSPVGGLVGSGASLAISNSYWYNKSQGLSCYSGGDSNCVSKINKSYFFNISNEPIKRWDFVNTWSSFCNLSGSSSLKLQGLSVVTSCVDYTTRCGDGSCNGVENCSSCLLDCGCQSGTCTNGTCVTTPSNNPNSPGTTTGSPAGGSTTANTYVVTAPQLIQGFSQYLASGDKIMFNMNSPSGGLEQHTVSFNGLSNNRAVLVLQSTIVNLNLSLNEERKFNLTSPNYYDFSVKFNSIVNSSKANLTVKSLYEPINANINQNPAGQQINNQINTMNNQTGTGETKKGTSIWFYVAIGFVVLIIVLVILIINALSKTKKEELQIDRQQPATTSVVNKEANLELVNYLKEGIRRGYDVNFLKRKLLDAKWDSSEIDLAISNLD